MKEYGLPEPRISEIMIPKPSVTQNEISKTLSISVATVKRTIKKMTENGVIERTGGRRYGEWIVKK
ncbi:MAG: winged helix-turn-helix domain-containing protein [Ruminococcus sp.]|nr:winged helix-turn-helix domain-containing protein [Ruminococcus sp.]